ncbi:Lipopolysaccharide-induced tumor necrosis factor-alpha factor [Fasciola hepatica]|uniref:Lipopolysaccharide-induced tumor necrosis factor-alpha factor n=1 Tax=Fasciola hepatica TaxID=6192 RepID=A0A4E0RCR7_FASHE|nr:Lipopolysaccharide-induced tumor necrosis factor-alpha factor [Fasciola hepatica]
MTQPAMSTQPQIQTIVVQPMQSDPVLTTCPYCQKQVTTKIDHENGIITYVCCVGIALLGCFLGCCLFPFCVDACKDVVHECPSCGKRIGSFKRV